VKPFLKKNNKILFTKIFKNTVFLCGFLLIFLNKNAFADLVRSTTFDDRLSCEKSRGSWRDFGNSCVDKCNFKFDKYAVCSYAITFGCDCGKNRCLYEDKCIFVDEYKKIDDQRILDDKKAIDEVKQKRATRAKKFQNEYLNKMAGIYGADPNYRDPNRYQQEKPLPPNTFKSTNRVLIYNHIIKKHNDKILANAKANEKSKDNPNNPVAEDEKDANNQLLNKENNPKLISLLKEPEEDKKLTQNNNNVVNNNAPIVLKEAEEGEPFEENLPPEQDSFLKNFSKKLNIQNALDEVNKVTKVDKVDKNQDSTNIPPVYVKQQNGETDFKNGDEINNIEGIPQFVN
jgi:uncharacterized protein YbcV (DUF1398 family)